MVRADQRRTIGVFFDAPGFDDYPFSIAEFRTAYHEVAALLADKGAHFCIVRGQATFLGGNRFQGYWSFAQGAFVRHDDAITLDLIYDKGSFVGDSESHLLNAVTLNELCVDKRKTIERFPQYSPRTVTVANSTELQQTLEQWSEDCVAVKPVDGAEAQGVVIGSAATILAASHHYPLLVQQYIDTSAGIPGILPGVGDLRTILVDGEVALTYARQAKDGSLISNVSKGGLEIEVLPDDRPSDSMDIVRAVDRDLAPLSNHRVFCVDLARDRSGRWFLIELNSKPGLSVRSYGVTYPRYQDLLVDALLSAADR